VIHLSFLKDFPSARLFLRGGLALTADLLQITFRALALLVALTCERHPLLLQ
jgi:hypothetical protein